jgi:hypothetical protein
LSRLISFLSKEYQTTLQLRQDSIKHVVVVSDDNGTSINAAQFKAQMSKAPLSEIKNIHINGFIGLTDGSQVIIITLKI